MTPGTDGLASRYAGEHPVVAVRPEIRQLPAVRIDRSGESSAQIVDDRQLK